MKTCTLCGGKLDQNKRCTFCGLDNSKNDDMYKHLANQNDCADEPLTHVHKEHTYSKPTYARPTYTARNITKKTKKPEKKFSKIVSLIVSIIILANTIYQCAAENRVEEGYVEKEISQGVTPDPYQGALYQLPDGAEIELEDLEFVTLTPSSKLPTVSVESYYNTYWK